MENEWGRINNK